MSSFRKGMLGLAALLAVFAAVLIIFCYTGHLSYVYCIMRESHWESATTRTQMECRLFAFYEARVVPTSKSSWGSLYELQPGERMVQYMIFGHEPYEVVYDAGDNVVETFTSYE